MKYGWLKDKLDIRDYSIRRFIRPASIPNKFNFVEQMPSVRDQGNVGSCVAFSSGAMKSYQDTLEYNSVIEVSPKFIYYEGRKFENRMGQEGMEIRSALEILRLLGTPLEVQCVYVNVDELVETNDLLAEATMHRIVSYARIDTIEDIRQTLAKSIPVVIGVPVFECWETDRVNRDGMIPEPKGNNVGGHAITLCGYNDDSKRFIFENSWGKDWALKSPVKPGYGTLSYYYLEQFLDTNLADAWSSVDQIVKL